MTHKTLDHPGSLQISVDARNATTVLYSPANGASQYMTPHANERGHLQEVTVPYVLPGEVPASWMDLSYKTGSLRITRVTTYPDGFSTSKVGYELIDRQGGKRISSEDLGKGERGDLDDIAKQLLDDPNLALHGPMLYDVAKAIPAETTAKGGAILLEAMMRGYVMMRPPTSR